MNVQMPLHFWISKSEHLGIQVLNYPTFGFILPTSAEDMFGSLQDENIRAEVRSTGSVRHYTAGNYITSCVLDLTYFPFDAQVCHVLVASWAYSSDMVYLQVVSDTFSARISHPQWEITQTQVHKQVWMDVNGEYEGVYHIMYLQRKPAYYLHILVLPTVLLSLLSLLMFCLPADSGEKVSLGITLLLAFTVFLLILADTMPRTSDQLPLLGNIFNI